MYSKSRSGPQFLRDASFSMSLAGLFCLVLAAAQFHPVAVFLALVAVCMISLKVATNAEQRRSTAQQEK